MTASQVPLDQNQNNQNQNQNQSTENQNQSQELETQTPNTPPVDNNLVPRSQLESTHELYRLALHEGETRRLELERQLEAARANNSQQQQIPEDQLTPAQIIERTVASQVAPLREQFSSFLQTQQQQTYQNIKNNFKNLPSFAQFWHILEPYLDQEMQGKPITVEQVQTSLATVIGRIQMQNAMNPQQVNPSQQQMPNNQQQQIPQNQNQNPPTNQNQNLPAHLRPSAPPLPNRNGNQNLTPNGHQMRPLTELEKRVAREQRPPLSDAQYIDWINEPTTNVIHSQIGIPPRTT